ncbi:metal ABC transporter ATP-binding protein [Cumulibacter soli]|uniref:metal ABC transporter ATP-binding protein n=1 Tax=Cumulibacter soli TaxID=2546344 RepID=UPI0014197635|nr:metal ABC transporter ATP-binding protein [Cumulibacter soli]
MPRSPSTDQDVVVQTRGLRAAYGSHTVLSDINLTVRRGEVLAIIGSNGSGKSTLMRSLIGLIPDRTGTVTLFGRDRITPAERKRIGYVPQRVSAASGVPSTVVEVVESGLLSGIFHRTGGARRRAAVDAALEATAITDLRSRPVAALSGGQQQRVLIARALVREPELLLLDEPLAGVDLEQQAAFATTLRTIAAADRTIILVLHEFGPIAPLLTRVISLDGGKVQYDASPQDAPTHCESNDKPSWVHAAHDHVHPHEAPEPGGAEWVPEVLSMRGSER